MIENLMCPISNIVIDRNVVRTNGLITTLLLVVYVLTGSPFIVPIGLDYVLRAMMHGPTSPMAWFAKQVAGAVGLPFRGMDKAPKVFASRIGVCFAMGSAITYFVAPSVSPWLAGTLAIFTALESIGDFCVGCHVYTLIFLPLFRARDAVKAIPLFRNLEDAMLIAVANGFRTKQMAQGERLLREGEPGDALFMLIRGEVEVYREEPGGAVTSLGKRGAGTVLGEMALLWDKPRSASVRALTPLTLLELAKADFEAMIERHPGMREILERSAEDRLASDQEVAGGQRPQVS